MTTQTPDLDKIKQTILKVKELAERGADGERQVAQNKLKSLLHKYGINISELQSDSTQERIIKHHKHPDSRKILVQVICSVKKTTMWKLKKGYGIVADLSYDDYIEVIEKYKYFWKLYTKQKEIFFQAFITNNKLYSAQQESSDSVPDKNPEELREIVRMMMSMSKGDYSSQSKESIKKIESNERQGI